MEIRKDKKALDKLYRRRDRYDLQPDFQREQVWSLEKEQILLDTILKKWDIPKIYLRASDDEYFEVTDGQQRLAAIYKFYDNKITLSKELSKEYGGLFYENLPTHIQDIFDDYELDITTIYNASDKEITELFSRLQLGVPLNSAEKLNAMLGNMRSFVKELSNEKFFSNLPLSRKRYAYQSVCAQIVKLEMDGLSDLKFKDLESFYKRNVDFNKNSRVSKKIIKILKLMGILFKDSGRVFRNRASIVSLYLLTSQLIDKGMDIKKNGDKLKEFYIYFQDSLTEEVQKGSNSKEPELMQYQSKVNQAADTKDAITTRNSILEKRLAIYNKLFQRILFKGKIDTVSIDNERKLEISSKANELVTIITDINKISSINGVKDVFKITNELLNKTKVLGEPVVTKSGFKNFIDAIYKIFYEGTGTLTRIPNKFINKESIFIEIKNLRTDLFHDIDHGKDKEVKNKRSTIAKVYKKYGGISTLVSAKGRNLFLIQKKILLELKKTLLSVKKDIGQS